MFQIKIEQNPGCPNKEYNAIYEYIHWNIGVYPTNKEKSTLDNDWETIIRYWEECEENNVSENKCRLLQMQLSALVGKAFTGSFYNLCLHVSLETAFSALKLTQNCYMNLNISFS